MSEAQEAENREQGIEKAALLPLDTPRVVVLKAKDKTYTYRLRRILAADWAAYFAGIVHQTIQHGDTRDEVFEAETALLELVDRTLVSVEGYGIPVDLRAWKLALPIKHRIAVGIALRSTGPSVKEEETADLSDLVEIALDSAWSAGEDGRMAMYSGLVHRFRQPTIAQLKRFNFESARVKVSGTADNGVTVYATRQAIAMKIYDDLIESVEGYSVNGQPLAGIAAIQQEMDGAHKAAAVLELFSASGDVGIQ